MRIEIDTTVTYHLTAGNREFKIDAWDFDEFISSLWKDKGTDVPAVNKDGTPVLNEDGTPKIERKLPWATINAEVSAWIEQNTGVKVRPHEVEILFDGWYDPKDKDGNPQLDENGRPKLGTFSKKKAMLLPQPDESPISPISTDQRFVA